MTAEFDHATPNMARVYDYWLDGKDNYPADRAEAQRLLGIYPPLRDLVRENRAFVIQAVGWAARQGIGQFIDLGAGLPASPAVHQAARTVMPVARVAYVDIDPVVLAHARALLATSDGVTAVAADLRDPGAVLADPQLRAVIDPARPVCVILGAVLHFLDAGAARAVTAGYARLTAPGSCLAISVASFDDGPWASSWPRSTPRQPGTTTPPPTSRRSSPDWSWWARAAPRRKPGGRGCPARYCGTAKATCWPAWHDAKHDLQRARLRGTVSAASGTSSPVTGGAEHHAVRHALAGDGADAAHGAGQPAVVELQGPS